MNMQTRNSSLVFARRGESQIRASELPPKGLVEQFTTMLLPHETKTPRGAPPSRWMRRNIDNMRSGKDGSVLKVIASMVFRKNRGEPVHQITAPLYLLAAAIEADGNDDIRTLRELDLRAELESTLAQQRYDREPTRANLALISETEAIEISISQRLIACASRQPQ